MGLEKSLNKIKNFISDRYKNNLAGILIFGTANTGEFKEGKSDIDTMIFLKQLKNLNFDKEIKFLINALKSENFATQYFDTLGGFKKHINERGSWSTYITIVSKDGSKILYSTPDFEEFRKELLDNPPSKEVLKKYIKDKDKSELEGYFKKIGGFKLTKALFAHLRRKLQIINYFQKKEIIFDYNMCLNTINLIDKHEEKLERLYSYYKNRRKLSKKEIDDYYALAEQFTNKIFDYDKNTDEYLKIYK